MKQSTILLLSFLFICLSGKAQFPDAYSSSQIFLDFQKVYNLGSVLYIAAHPDDENTRLISYFENGLLARTAYLSLTRGDGGQNLVGTEIGAAIGVLRTQELLAARRIDGGEQYFSRAVDFGYSKSSLETLDKWDKDEVLADVVWVIRKFRPDAIVTRFPPNNYAGHGHHEASAMLAEDAFVAAGDPKRFPEQLEYVDTWQPTRLYFNTSSWWNKDLPERARDNDNFLRVNVGEYNALLGETYARIASRSRSQHKSQGFGTDVYYGLNIEYMEYVMGGKAQPEGGILDGVNRSWGAINAPDVGEMLGDVLENYKHDAPHESIPGLIETLKLIAQKGESPERNYKINEIEALVLKMAGVYIEAISDHAYYTSDSEIAARVNMVHQYPDAIAISVFNSAGGEAIASKEVVATTGAYYSEEASLQVPKNAAYSNHYWLNAPYEGMFVVDDKLLRGKPENTAAIEVQVKLDIDSYTINQSIALQHKKVDPVKAVIYRPVNIVPALTFSFSEDVIVNTNSEPKRVALYVTHHEDGINGALALKLPSGWQSTPESIALSGKNKGTVERLEFELKGATGAGSGTIGISFAPSMKDSRTGSTSRNSQANTWSEYWNLSEISYDHIPTQIYMKPASIALQSFEFDKGDVQRIGYIEGPGDDVAKYLRSAGYDVDVISAEDVQSGKLKVYDAVITGIRAFNTREELVYLNDKLNEYVHQGGTLLVQYNTSRGLQSQRIGPFDFTIGRERVTDEEAQVNMLMPGHPAMNQPNKIRLADFDGWVQERGLYFASEWDPAFSPLLGWSDPGEPERKGGLIAAPHGKGYFIYSGISFFRQLPAGVPGSYRLLSNLLNLKNSNTDKP